MIGGDDKPDITTDLPDDEQQPDSNPDDGGVDDGASEETSRDDQSTDDGSEDESNEDESGDDGEEGGDDQSDDETGDDEEDQNPPYKHRSQSREGERVGAPLDQAPQEHQQALRVAESDDDKCSGENGPGADDDPVDEDAEADEGKGVQHQDQESGQQTNGDANKNGH